MRALVLVTTLAACSSGSPSAKLAEARPDPPAANAQALSIASLVGSSTTGIAVWRPSDFMLITLLDRAMPDMFECWRGFEQRIEAAYQVFSEPRGSFVVLVGDLPRAEVEKCVADNFLYNRMSSEDMRRDGELTVVATKFGTVHAAWRGRFVVLGDRDHVTEALVTHAPSPVWTEALGELQRESTTSSLVAITADATFAGLLGVPTTRWKLTLETPPTPWAARELLKDSATELDKFAEQQERLADRKAKGLPPEPPPPPPSLPLPPSPPKDPHFTGRLELRHATAADARRAAQILATRSFAVPVEDNLAVALSKLDRSVTGSTLVARFDQTSFAGLELAKLQAWVVRLQAAAANLPKSP